MSYKAKSNGNNPVVETSITPGFETYTTARGIEVTVHPVPQQIVRGVTSGPKPKRPIVDMPTLGGKASQKRPVKEGDPEWEDYNDAVGAWEDATGKLQEAVSFSMALKSHPYPTNFTFSAEVMLLVELGLMEMPDNPFLLKLMWLRENVLGQHDEFNITMIINKLSGVPQEMVEQMKHNFRNILLGRSTGSVGTEAEVQRVESEVQQGSDSV